MTWHINETDALLIQKNAIFDNAQKRVQFNLIMKLFEKVKVVLQYHFLKVLNLKITVFDVAWHLVSQVLL